MHAKSPVRHAKRRPAAARAASPSAPASRLPLSLSSPDNDAALSDDSQNFEGIIVAGGDGLINEVQNGNLHARRLPIAVVPSGGLPCLPFSLPLPPSPSLSRP